jgi:hypothetical protein
VGQRQVARIRQALSGGLDLSTIARSQLVVVNDETGADDDAKIESWLSYIGGLSSLVKPVGLFLPKTDGSNWHWNDEHVLFPGCQLLFGFQEYANEPRGGGGNVRIDTTRVGGQWTIADGTQGYGIYFGAATWVGTSSTDWYDATTTGTVQEVDFGGGGWSGYRSMFGRAPSEKMSGNTFTLHGTMNWNNIRETGCCFGGSDGSIIPTRLYVDSNPTSTPMTGAPNAYLMRFDWLEKTPVKHLYITADRNCGMRIDGPQYGAFGSHQGHLDFSDSIIEGRNETTPAYGELVRILGGGGKFKDCWLSYAMSNPSLITNRTARGVVAVEGGSWEFEGCDYRPARARTASVTTTSGSATISGTFTSADVGRMIEGSGIQDGSVINSQTGSAAVMSKTATASATITANLYVDAPFIWVGSTARARVSNQRVNGDQWGTGLSTRLKPKVYVQAGADFDADTTVDVVNI